MDYTVDITSKQWLEPTFEKLQITDEFIELFNKNDYYGMVESLKRKYGEVPFDYFEDGCTSKCSRKGQNRKGLQIHHIKEDTLTDLSRAGAKAFRFFRTFQINEDEQTFYTYKDSTNPKHRNMYYCKIYQRREYLVYANIYEHIALHLVLSTMKAKTDIWKGLPNSEEFAPNLGMGGVAIMGVPIIFHAFTYGYLGYEKVFPQGRKKLDLLIQDKNTPLIYSRMINDLRTACAKDVTIAETAYSSLKNYFTAKDTTKEHVAIAIQVDEALGLSKAIDDYEKCFIAECEAKRQAQEHRKKVERNKRIAKKVAKSVLKFGLR